MRIKTVSLFNREQGLLDNSAVRLPHLNFFKIHILKTSCFTHWPFFSFYLLFSDELQHCERNTFFITRKKAIFSSKISLEWEAEMWMLKERTWADQWARGVTCWVQIFRRLVFTCLNGLYASPDTCIKLKNAGSLLLVFVIKERWYPASGK